MKEKNKRFHWKYIFDFVKVVFYHWFTLVFFLPDFIAFLVDNFFIEVSISWNVRIGFAFVCLLISAFRAYSSIRHDLEQVTSKSPKLSVGFIDPDEKTKIVNLISFPVDLLDYPNIEELKTQEEQNLWDRYYKEKENPRTLDRNKPSSDDKEISIHFINPVKNEEIYRKELSDYIPKYEKFLVDQWEFYERENHIRSVKIYLANYGTDIAKNIHMSIILFSPLSLDIDEEFILISNSPPSPPQQPSPIKRIDDIFKMGISDRWSRTRVRRDLKSSKKYLTETYIDNGRSHRKYEIEHIYNTGDTVCIDEFYIRFPKTSKPGDRFKIQTKLIYENLAKAEEGYLELILTNSNQDRGNNNS